jgi:hypothetical protein
VVAAAAATPAAVPCMAAVTRGLKPTVVLMQSSKRHQQQRQQYVGQEMCVAMLNSKLKALWCSAVKNMCSFGC